MKGVTLLNSFSVIRFSVDLQNLVQSIPALAPLKDSPIEETKFSLYTLLSMLQNRLPSVGAVRTVNQSFLPKVFLVEMELAYPTESPVGLVKAIFDVLKDICGDY